MAEPDRTEAARTHGNTGHGHVWPRPDGMRARCGGPGLCAECSRDKALRDKQGEMPVTPAPEPTNAEVSDERLREIEGWAKLVSTFPQAEGHPPPERYADIAAVCTELIARRSVTSQASEGAGWKLVPVEPTEEMYGPKDAPTSFAHFIRFGDFCHSYKAMLAAAPAASPSKRVERLEALKECAKIAHTAHLQCVDERDRIRQNTPEFGYAQAKVEAVTAVWHLINELLPKEPSSGQALQGGRS